MIITDWMPVISKLVYPFIIAVILIIFSDETKEIYNEVVSKGRGAKLGLFEISARADEVEIKAFSAVSVGLEVISDIVPQTVEEANNIVRKSSGDFLLKVQEELRKNPDRSTIKSLVLESGRNYSTKLLREYINQLGIENIVFIKTGMFEGLIDARLLINQLPPNQVIPYEQIIIDVLGINKSFVFENTSTLDVLKSMGDSNIEKIAVVDGNRKLRFIAEREVIVSKLIASIITQDTTKQK